MTKNKFITLYIHYVDTNHKLQAIKLAYYNRSHKVKYEEHSKFIEYHGFKEIKNFIDNNFKSTKYCANKVWNYIKGNKPFDISIV